MMDFTHPYTIRISFYFYDIYHHHILNLRMNSSPAISEYVGLLPWKFRIQAVDAIIAFASYNNAVSHVGHSNDACHFRSAFCNKLVDLRSIIKTTYPVTKQTQSPLPITTYITYKSPI